MNTPGTLYIVPTPIGNLDDITFHCLKILFSVSFIACEDTRKTGLLLKLLRDKYSAMVGVKRDEKEEQQLISFYEQNELQRTPNVLNALQNGFDVALVSDAGTPLISDPGYRLVQACIEHNISIISLPGPSAILVSLCVAGLPTDKFTFLGYPPQKSGHRKTFYETIKNIAQKMSSTFILFEAPHKLTRTLTEFSEVVGNIDIVVCRELTKLHEEVWRGSVLDALSKFKKPKGEYVILFHM